MVQIYIQTFKQVLVVNTFCVSRDIGEQIQSYSVKLQPTTNHTYIIRIFYIEMRKILSQHHALSQIESCQPLLAGEQLLNLNTKKIDIQQKPYLSLVI